MVVTTEENKHKTKTVKFKVLFFYFASCLKVKNRFLYFKTYTYYHYF